MRHLVLGLVMALLLVANQAAASGTAPVAYLSNSASSNVIAVDTSSSASTPTSIPVGTTTYGVAVGLKGTSAGKVFVTGQSGLQGKLYVIDTAARPATVTTVPVGLLPFGVAVSHDGSRVYVANAMSRNLSVIDTAPPYTVGTPIALPGFAVPFGIAASPVRDCLYVANVYGSYAVSVVDTTTNQVVAGVPSLDGRPAGVAVAMSPDGTHQRVYVADNASGANGTAGTVWAFDTPLNSCAAGPLGATLTVGANPFAIAVTPDGKRVYVSNSGSGVPGSGLPGTVSVFDFSTVSSGVSSLINVGGGPQGVSVSSDGATVYVANFYSANLTAISVANNTTRTIAPAGVQFPIAFGNFVTPITFITVNFDVVPKAINPKAQGTIPVIIYGSKSFDVHTLDLSLLRLNGMKVEIKPNGEPMANYGDFKGSGYDDVMVHFSTEGIQANPGDATVTLTGQTICSPLPCSGTPIQGTATVTFLH